jgi:hypothetical protein
LFGQPLAVKRQWLREHESDARRSRAAGRGTPADYVRILSEIAELERGLAARGEEQRDRDEHAEVGRRALLPGVLRRVATELGGQLARVYHEELLRPLAEMEAGTMHFHRIAGAWRRIAARENPPVLPDRAMLALGRSIRALELPIPADTPPLSGAATIPLRVLREITASTGDTYRPGEIVHTPPDLAHQLLEQHAVEVHDPYLEDAFDLLPGEWCQSRGFPEPPPGVPVPEDRGERLRRRTREKQEAEARRLAQALPAQAELAKLFPLG